MTTEGGVKKKNSGDSFQNADLQALLSKDYMRKKNLRRSSEQKAQPRRDEFPSPYLPKQQVFGTNTAATPGLKSSSDLDLESLKGDDIAN
jgi:hypothetical protein